MIITVLGATGKTGGAVVEGLLAAGIQVKAVARSAAKLADLSTRGVTAVSADISDAAALTEALTGSDGAYLMIPGDYTKPDLLGQYARAGDAIVEAVRASGVKRAAFLSSLGGEAQTGTGPIVGLHQVEERLRGIAGLNLLILRPGYFYENHFGTLGLIKQQGINGSAIEPTVSMKTIAARDIGAAAAQSLAKADFSGVVVRELAGPRDLTMADVTRVLGQAIGKPDLPYVRFPDQGYVDGLKQAGLSPDAAQLLLEMAQAFNQGLVRSQPDTDKVRTSTSIESFAESFAHAYRG